MVAVTVLQRLAWIGNTIFHQAVAVFTVVILWVFFENNEIDSVYLWHVVLSTVAYVPLMAEAIILFSGDNVWSQSITRTQKYYIHGAILLLSAISVTVGIAIFIDEIGNSRAHFTSIHGITGLVSWILVLLSVFLGLLSAKSQSLKNILRPVYFKFCHNIVGILGFVVGIVSLGYGLEKQSFPHYTSQHAQTASYVILGLIGIWTLLAAFRSVYNQVKAILS